MDSIELGRLERRARRAYEWARVRRAVWGFGPALLVVALAAGVSKRPSSALLFGSMMFGLGVLLLWYGRDLRRAVLPGFAFGLLPLALALCANHLGHVCTGDACYSLCVPACSVGGLGAGLGVSYLGRRTEHGYGFWGAAAALSLLTGSMGCSCVGWGGVAGLVAGYAVGLVPMVARRLRHG